VLRDIPGIRNRLWNRGSSQVTDTGTGGGGGSRARGQGSRRARRPGRHAKIEFSLADDELAVVAEAAERARLSKGAYAALVVLAAARGEDDGPTSPLRDAVRELVHASGLARRLGINLNQAVARLNAAGYRPGDLERLEGYGHLIRQVAGHLDDACEHVRKAIR
jgi:hypothetical protein